MNKIELFKKLHESDELLVLGNAWDLPSARVFEKAGFKAIGTTSWGIAASLGYADGEAIEFELQLSVIQRIVDNVQIPVTADIESGYGHNDETILSNVLKVANLGASGINIEDSMKGATGLKQLSDQCHLLTKIRGALDNNGFVHFFINARIDAYLLNLDPLNETLTRLKAYVESGASGIFVPGLKHEEEIKTIASCTSAPLNVMALPGLADCDKLKKLGVRRLSLGGALYRKTATLLEQCALEMLDSRDTSILFE
ncbi:isocitrate lyase/phosphoenolpyruvate mutase family protein [Paenibacillus sp. sptzw28]|uniref:isocitrate lyase/PEP mutase family protein n=1 Tax=Paenibacillus sp. sptzw28 TaxID=715179 RepID=UPI001C6E0518|nr:isocitrate lyase/phosphoenolpyruvate mutase family protein [Paenibacillus sp. sptzw28]QYR19198.1 isocitrate lyase/phosphoenolpyruvate mutase family protein [Paenibacillus sp. sptzw28]